MTISKDELNTDRDLLQRYGQKETARMATILAPELAARILETGETPTKILAETLRLADNILKRYGHGPIAQMAMLLAAERAARIISTTNEDDDEDIILIADEQKGTLLA